MEVSFVFVVSGIPSRARWLDELGALVGTVMLPRHRRAGQAIALLTGLRPDGCSQAFPLTSKLFQPSDLITAFCELSTQHILFRLTVLVHCWSPRLASPTGQREAMVTQRMYLSSLPCRCFLFLGLELHGNNGYLRCGSLFRGRR